MKRLENIGRKLSYDEQLSIKGGTYPVTSCSRKCTINRTGFETHYIVQGDTCGLAQCFPFDIDNGCTCETHDFRPD